jgi:ppGpp synthetase/RelA/SpoT-type nucleotidyltranferase
MEINFENLKQQVESISHSIAHDLERDISKHFDKCGLFYRIFSRCKSANSTVSKLKLKSKKYEEENKKMQDLLGVRLALYFKDDIDVCINIITSHYNIIEIVRDEEHTDTFSPIKLNIVCEMPKTLASLFSSEIWDFPIDKTFEIQIRTIFSEGWHEVEHDLRYKHKSDWDEHLDLSRNLNGIFATLETCDWAILNVFEQLSYQKYKTHDWNAMLRNHFRIRTDENTLSPQLEKIFNENPAVAKEFLKSDRKVLLLWLSNPIIKPYPKNLSTIVFITNALIVKNKDIFDITPSLIKTDIEKLSIT